ncbi:PLAT/LH2 domain-containing protein [Archangium gephyra]|uniref:PLAT/LH2 domain-containing protein n=1 Tax=Archangium gephyra TaxID=48 RepID=UPI0035D42754
MVSRLGDPVIHRIKYWFWYNFNDYPTGPDPLGHHEGDWEHVEVIVTGFQASQVLAYILSNHDKRITLWPGTVTKTGTHPHVWVANGSHACYPSPGAPLYNFSKLGMSFADELADGGAQWATWENLKDMDQTTFARENFLGRWGNHTFRTTLSVGVGPWKKTWEYVGDPPESPIGRRLENEIPFYKIEVFTGARDKAGTDADVFIQLFGDRGVSPRIMLDDYRDNFERGSHDVFSPGIGSRYGVLYRVLIGFDTNKGDNPGWFLDKVHVTDMYTHQLYVFPCNQWLAKDEGDGRTVRYLDLQRASVPSWGGRAGSSIVFP